MLSGGSRDLLERFGITRFREEVMIHGVRDARVVGKLVVTSARGEFNAYDRELLEVFADFLRQRVVDFNKEWKALSLSFPPSVVNRLLGEEGYAKKHLSPRVAEVAILYADISGFSRVSEQVLREPALIGKLIDVWGAEVMRILWDTGGVFDKMVGDCIIAFFGPPFNEMTPRDASRRALSAAIKIREFTRTLNDGTLIPELKGVTPPVGVATGLNYCPLCVGFFGPDEDYTGFSSGMNSTARLQGVATRDEILCMDTVVAALGEDGFSDELTAKVKNVGEPLRYRKWLSEA
jgi:class 3 adenylate cyclase